MSEQKSGDDTTSGSEDAAAAGAMPLIRPIVRPPANLPPRTRVELDDDTEREIEEAIKQLQGEELLQPAPRSKLPARQVEEKGPKDNRKRGRVVAIQGTDIIVDMGGKSEGVVAMDQFPEGVPAVGSAVDVLIERYDANEGVLI